MCWESTSQPRPPRNATRPRSTFFILLLSIATLAYDRCRPKRPEVESGQSLLAADTDFLGPGAHDERVRRRADRAAAPAPAVEMPSLLDTDFEGRSLI